MAGFDCIASTAKSLERLLSAAFAEASPIPGGGPAPPAVLIRAEDLEEPGVLENPIRSPGLSILLYRVEVNRTVRAGWSAAGSLNGRAHLPLDLHFLLTPWASNAEYELRILGRAMQCLEEHPSLTGPLLVGPGWAAGDSVQLTVEDVSTETVMRTFDSLPHEYKLSVPYAARVVRLDSLGTRPPAEVAEATVVVNGALP